MKLVKVLVLLVLSIVLIAIPASAEKKSSVKVTPTLWIWHFEAGLPYPDPCYNTPVKINLELLAMNRDMVTHDIEISAKIFNSGNQLIYMKYFGVTGPGASCLITVMDFPQNYNPGKYSVEIKAICNSLGKTETINRSFTIN